MKTVALVDHYYGGHHITFIKLFAKYLLKLDYRVCIYFPTKEKEITEYLSENGCDRINIKFYQNNLKKRKVKCFGRFNNPLSTLILWWETRQMLKKSEKHLGVKLDMIFFAWLDDHLANDLPYQFVDFIFPFCWSGLYFHPWYLYEDQLTNHVSMTSSDSVLRSKNCISVAVHDEFVLEKLNNRLKKRAIFFPEIADSTKPDVNYDLVKKIKLQAGNRIIIGLIGISKRKGFLFLVQLAKMADPNRYFFFFSGDLLGHDFNSEEELLVNDFIFKNQFENCFYHPKSIEEGAKINAVINAVDIVFIVYNNFKSSSNFNTKAALFKKPVLATKRFWIGRTTEKYGVGKVVTEGNSEEMLEALESLSIEIKENSFNAKGFDNYLLVHDEQNLENAFRQVF